MATLEQGEPKGTGAKGVDKVQVLLAPVAGVAMERFQAVVADSVTRLDGQRGKGVGIRAGFLLKPNPIGDMPHSQKGSAATFEGLIEFFSDGDGAGRATVDGLVGSLHDAIEPVVDWQQSAVIAGREYRLLPGWGELQLVFALRRKPSLSRTAFQDYWLNHHAGYALEQGVDDRTFYYRQFHTDGCWSGDLARDHGFGIADFDGVAEVYYQSVEEIAERFSRPEVSRDAYADEKTFIDHERSWLGFFRMFRCDR
jgi:hypothetical protein